MALRRLHSRTSVICGHLEKDDGTLLETHKNEALAELLPVKHQMLQFTSTKDVIFFPSGTRCLHPSIAGDLNIFTQSIH